jgi:hypothetical protein
MSMVLCRIIDIWYCAVGDGEDGKEESQCQGWGVSATSAQRQSSLQLHHPRPSPKLKTIDDINTLCTPLRHIKYSRPSGR